MLFGILTAVAWVMYMMMGACKILDQEIQELRDKIIELENKLSNIEN